ncbi:peptidoglycan-binding domain-containing protein [Xylanimonas protaetiae]|uniref:Peptidoglycan-binding protein n=1 Tax=Xylanimonas protaetiae TaxID=2509457 RepID=A0A4P6F0F6_9MICO|nr:peptidoglycan-binding domain-containing protein [Xylanimonas protaetiae]QAY68666.1 peptidoglycan-binding protein [Xylanimonas protaetiae]
MSRRRRALAVGVAAVVVAGLGGAWLVLPRGAGAGAPAATSAPPPTVAVVRTDLADRQVVPAVLGFGTPTTVSGHGTGTVTALPAPGTVVNAGQTLYRVDDRPVTLFVGATPFFRTLSVAPPPGGGSGGSGDGSSGSDGSDGSGGSGGPGGSGDGASSSGAVDVQGRPTGGDVAVLKANLEALGYPVGTRTDPVYTQAVAAGVRAWQKDTGLPVTGSFDPAWAVVLPTSVRVEAVSVAPGADADGPLMTVTPTTRLVTVTLSPVQGAAFPVGTAVTVLLADGTRVPATVAAVATTQGPDGTAQATATVTADDPAALDAATSDAVRVELTGQTRSQVLAVPVSALLALAGGGYALQEADGTLVAVTTGLFADGLVEVSGDGVVEGQQVVDAR